MNSKITLSGYILVPKHELQTIRDALVEHVALTRAEPGCLVFNVTESNEVEGRFDVYEEFLDSDAFHQHQSRVKASQWGELSNNVLRHYATEGLDE